MPRIVCISDTHNQNGKLNIPDGDILIHAGDALMAGNHIELVRFNSWFSALKHKVKIFVAGNHDRIFEDSPAEAKALLDDSIIYLQDESVEVCGLKFYGSPWTPIFYDWAFNLERGEEMAKRWRQIPDDTDILITHGPPRGINDVVRGENGTIRNEGCDELLERINELKLLRRLKLHVFGHIHEGYGIINRDEVVFVNASICKENYKPVNNPIVLDL